MSNLNTSFDFLQDFLRQDQQGMDFMQEIPSYIDPRTGMVIREDEDLEIERKYYQKPDIDPMSPIGAMPFLQNFVQGM